MARSSALTTASKETNGPARVGPAGLVGACLDDAVGRLQAQLGERVPLLAWSTGPDAVLETIAGWISTALDCSAVKGFSFDPESDPVHAW